MYVIRKLIDLLLYGHFWIAGAALAMCLQTQLLLVGDFYLSPFSLFVFFGTLFLYAMHRVVGLARVRPFQKSGRYFIIARFKKHILIYALLAGLVALWFYLKLPRFLQFQALWPCLLAAGYVLPILFGRKRLRDLSYVKIFLIALVWVWLTVYLPAAEYHLRFNIPMYLMCLERFFFVFAITLPFDIRDLKIDAYTKVKTLPARLGLKSTILLATLLLLLSLLFILLNVRLGVYPLPVAGALGLSLLVSFGLIYYSGRAKSDYYFTGLLDGTMPLQFLLVWLAVSGA